MVRDEGGVAGLQGSEENEHIRLHRPRNYRYDVSGFCFFNSETFPGTENDKELSSRIIAFRGTALNGAGPSRTARQIERKREGERVRPERLGRPKRPQSNWKETETRPPTHPIHSFAVVWIWSRRGKLLWILLIYFFFFCFPELGFWERYFRGKNPC